MIGYKEFLNDLNETNFKPKVKQGEIVPKSGKDFESRVHYGLIAQKGLSISLDGKVLVSQDDFNGEMPIKLKELLDGMVNYQDKKVLLAKYNRFVKEVSKK